jgi:hypothetical protein
MRFLFIIGLLLSIASTARPQDQLDVTTVVVPVVGSILGASGVHWKTDIELRNDYNVELTVSLTLPSAGEERFIIVSIAPGESLRYTDVVGQAFGMEAGLSPLIVQTEGRRSVTVRATAYGMRGTEVFPPQPIVVNYGPTYFPTRVLPNLSFNDDFRTNVGLVNLGDQPAEVIVALQRVPGRNLAVNRILLPANSLWHSAIQQMFPLITNGDHFSVVVETPARDTHVYASVVDNHTNGARFIAPTLGMASASRH